MDGDDDDREKIGFYYYLNSLDVKNIKIDLNDELVNKIIYSGTRNGKLRFPESKISEVILNIFIVNNNLVRFEKFFHLFKKKIN